jgi:hypothetical protein
MNPKISAPNAAGLEETVTQALRNAVAINSPGIAVLNASALIARPTRKPVNSKLPSCLKKSYLQSHLIPVSVQYVS